jgi:phage-related protein
MLVADAVGVGFTLAGHASSEFGAFCTDYSIPPLPNVRENDIEVPGIVGVYDAGTELARTDITMQVGFYTATGGRAGIKDQIRRFIATIDPRNGYVDLTMDEDPDYYLVVKLSSVGGSEGVAMQPVGRNGECAATVDLSFKIADPHWYSNVQGDTLVDGITSATPVNIDNAGTSAGPVLVTATATGAVNGGFTITIAGKQMTYQGNLVAGDVVIFDTDNWTVTVNGANGIAGWAGTFPWLPGGVSNVTVSKANLQVSLRYTPRWVI